MKASDIKECPLCLSKDRQVYEVDYPFLGYQDFTVIKPGGRIGECLSCGLLFNMDSFEDPAFVESLYTDKAYLEKKETNHYVCSSEYKQPVTQYFLQARLLEKYLPENPSILDIGCFDGKLLREFRELNPVSRLHGFDIDCQRRPLLPEDVVFWDKDLNKIDGTFDLICISHTIQYIEDIRMLFIHLKRVLKKDGIVFIQVPNLIKNPYAALYGDVHYYYTPQILESILSFFGFSLLNIDEKNLFERDIVCAASYVGGNNPVKVLPDPIIPGCIEYFKDVEQRLLKFKHNSLGIFGTTINAGFTSAVLGSRVGYFVDENPSKQGNYFQGKQVLHPDKLTRDNVIILPYGRFGSGMYKKLSTMYKGNFILI
ncbi:MAG: methyltransferase domain-containing protein [Desulfobacteraceae bacterium]|nr:methyltransferase domain-containing protein [Desulfobacteraceae bacterium]